MTHGFHGFKSHELSTNLLTAYVVESRGMRVRNISQIGASIQTNHPLVIGQMYAFLFKTRENSVIIDGMVVRCSLSELAESTEGGQLPLYHNGIEFHMPRSQKEAGLMCIIQENLFGEKRLGAQRITPITDLRVDIARDCFTHIEELNGKGMLVECGELLDMDVEWLILLQAREDWIETTCRIVHASKKEDQVSFKARLEFMDLAPEVAQFLDKASDHPPAPSV